MSWKRPAHIYIRENAPNPADTRCSNDLVGQPSFASGHGHHFELVVWTHKGGGRMPPFGRTTTVHDRKHLGSRVPCKSHGLNGEHETMEAIHARLFFSLYLPLHWFPWGVVGICISRPTISWFWYNLQTDRPYRLAPFRMDFMDLKLVQILILLLASPRWIWTREAI